MERRIERIMVYMVFFVLGSLYAMTDNVTHSTFKERRNNHTIHPVTLLEKASL